MKNKKILVLSFYFNPDLSAGSFRMTSFVDALKKKIDNGDHINVITTLPNRYLSFSIEAPSLEKEALLTINRIALPQHKSGMFDQTKAFIIFTYGVMNLTRGKDYDIVFATSSRLMTAALGALISRRKRVPLYLDIRDIFIDTINDVLPKYITVILKPILQWVERWTIQSASKVNLVSQGFSGYFTKLYPKQSYSYFTNGIDEEFLSLSIPEYQPKNIKIVQVLYAGNIGEGQGLHEIIPNLAKRMVGRIQFKIIGDGGRKEELRIALEKTGVDNFEILPPINRKQLIKEYLAADVLFIHLNDYEAFKKVLPSKIFEYGVMGKPIWAGVSGYCAQFIGAELENAVVFRPCDDVDAERAFNKILFKGTLRNKFSEKYARKNIVENLANDVVDIIK